LLAAGNASKLPPITDRGQNYTIRLRIEAFHGFRQGLPLMCTHATLLYYSLFAEGVSASEGHARSEHPGIRSRIRSGAMSHVPAGRLIGGKKLPKHGRVNG
jgi:hypothetical protein